MLKKSAERIKRTRRRMYIPGRMGEQQAIACDQPPRVVQFVRSKKAF